MLRTGEIKTPRLKSPEANSEVQPDPNSLLVIGDDGISHAVKFLAAKELCQSEMTCKSLRMFAAPILNRLVDDMNKKCDQLSEGKGSRTKLLRYLAAKEMAENVRGGLDDHLSRIHDNGTTLEAKCRGCDSSFPQSIDNQVFYTDGSGYEFFLYCFEMGKSDLKFEGFMPMRGTVETDWEEENLTLYNFTGDFPLPVGSNWNEMTEFMSVEDIEADTDWLFQEEITRIRNEQRAIFETIATSNLTIIAVAIDKRTCRAHFLGAGSDFTNREYWSPHEAFAFGGDSVLCNVHMDSHSIAKDTNIAKTSFCIESQDIAEGNLSIELAFWGDEEDHFGIL